VDGDGSSPVLSRPPQFVGSPSAIADQV